MARGSALPWVLGGAAAFLLLRPGAIGALGGVLGNVLGTHTPYNINSPTPPPGVPTPLGTTWVPGRGFVPTSQVTGGLPAWLTPVAGTAITVGVPLLGAGIAAAWHTLFDTTTPTSPQPLPLPPVFTGPFQTVVNEAPWDFGAWWESQGGGVESSVGFTPVEPLPDLVLAPITWELPAFELPSFWTESPPDVALAPADFF